MYTRVCTSCIHIHVKFGDERRRLTQMSTGLMERLVGDPPTPNDLYF